MQLSLYRGLHHEAARGYKARLARALVQVADSLDLQLLGKWDNLRVALPLQLAYYSFCRIQGSLRVTPAMDSSIALLEAEMTDEEYEKKYQDALNEIRAKGKKVGHPQRSHDGVRYCRINNFPYTDRLIFKQAYGQLIANQILRERTGD